MKLNNILKKLDSIEKIEGKVSLDITGITCNSKKVRDGNLFIAMKGERLNGIDFIDEAIDRGASAIFLESIKDKTMHLKKGGAAFIYVKNLKAILPKLCKIFYGNVSEDMFLIGVTGTNGKTTITYLMERLLNASDKSSGVIGTINYRFGGRSIPALNTTPGILDLYYLLNSMQKENINNVIMEVSSHSLAQGRVDDLFFDIAIFTNLTSEHMDYHKDMEGYFKAKLRLFKKIKHNGYMVVNKDDLYGQRIIDIMKDEAGNKLVSYGIGEGDVYADNVKFSFDGVEFMLHTSRGSIEIKSSLIGRYNVYNILASAASAVCMGMSLEKIKQGVESLKGLPGRLEKVHCGQAFSIFVDYAHTENGLQNVLESLKELSPKRIFTVFGCGGDRDRTKRPLMGNISTRLSDKVFLTSDNPRSEEPIEIIKEIIKGISKDNYVVEIDRAKAINMALEEAKKGDIVLVAGKGHETYQIFKNNTLPFDDKEVIRRYLCLQSKMS